MPRYLHNASATLDPATRPRRTRRPRARDRRLALRSRTPAARSGSTTRRSSAGIRASDIKGFDDLQRFGPFEDEWLRGGPVAALGAEGAGGQAGLRLRDRRHHRHAEDAHRHRRLPDRLRDVQRHAAGRVLSRRASNWLMLGPSGPRRLRLVGRAPGPVPRRHLLLRRSRSALGDQADQEGLDRAPAGLQGSRHRSGGHDPSGRPRHPVHVHDAEAARGAGAAARVDGHDHPADRASPASSAAAPSSRRSGTASPSRSCSTAPT